LPTPHLLITFLHMNWARILNRLKVWQIIRNSQRE
jgi:hypothetical protein